MKNKIFKYIFINLLLVSFWACDDYLERLPLDSPSDATFLENGAELELAVNAAYNRLWFNSWPMQITFQMWLDMISDIGWDRNSGGNIYSKGDYDSQSGLFENVWQHYYEGIGRCNFILTNMDRAKNEVDQTDFDTYKGEAKFLRALYYHYLTELYGDVPLITTTITVEEAKIGRTSKSKVVDFLISELEEASDMLPETQEGSNKGRATSGAALTLLSRVALFNERYEIAANAAIEVINSGTYNLYPDYENLFKYEGEGNNEVIFDIQYQEDAKRLNTGPLFSRNAPGWLNKIPVQALVDKYECTDGLRIDESPLYDPANPFRNRDPRLHQTVALPGSVWLGYQYETHPDSLEVWNYNTDPPTRIANRDVTHPAASYSGYGWRKYTDRSDLVDRQHTINFIIMRYAEVLLNYAEAKIEMNQIDQSVYDAMNTLRQRESVMMPEISTGKTQQELRTIIRRERVAELAGEGFRLFDIRRWKIAEDAMNVTLYGKIDDSGWYSLQGIPEFDENGIPDYSAFSDIFRVIEIRNFNPERDYLWPIPQKELDINPNIEQNPNY